MTSPASSQPELARNALRSARHLRKLITLAALAFALLTFATASVFGHATAQVELQTTVLQYEMDSVLTTEGQLIDLSLSGSHGNLSGFPDPGAAFGEDPPGDSYLSFDGAATTVWSNEQVQTINAFTLEVEFRTTTPGGKLLGFEDLPTGTGRLFDRHLYIATDGTLRFGGPSPTLAAAQQVTISTLAPVTDGEWHTVVAISRPVQNAVEYELFLDGELQATSIGNVLNTYPGHWRIGSGNLSRWPGTEGTLSFFEGDVRRVVVYEDPPAIAPEPAPTETPAVVIPTPSVEFFHEEPPGPKIDISSDVDGDALTLDITFENVELFDTSVWVVREDGDEFFVGDAQPSMSWTGEARTSRYTVELRWQAFDGEEGELIASKSVPVLVQPASATEAVAAVAASVAVVGTVAAASSSGTWIYQLIWRFLRILINENFRRRTKSLDVHSIPSWISVIVAMVLMALLIAAGKPGALAVNSFTQALIVSTPIVLIYRGATLLGGYGLAYITQQQPRYLIWAAGTLTFAFTSIVLHSPIGYTGYLERESGEKARDARFTAAGFAAVLALAGLFMVIGLLGRMSFGEAGVTLTLGVLAVTMLPFPMLGGHTIWKWNRNAGIVSGISGMVLYLLFQLGFMSPTAVLILGIIGFILFIGILLADLWLMIERRIVEWA